MNNKVLLNILAVIFFLIKNVLLVRVGITAIVKTVKNLFSSNKVHYSHEWQRSKVSVLQNKN